MDKEKDDAPEIQESTKVEQADIDIDALFGQPGADSVMVPSTDEPEPEKKPNMFSKETVDTGFIDKPAATTTTETPASTEESQEQPPAPGAEDDLQELDKLINDEEDKGNTGRPKLDKNGLVDLTSKMIEEGTLIPFDDDKDISEYSVKDFRELFEANFQEREAKLKESLPGEFFQSLPEELQIAAKYVADGGTDLKGLFRTLSQVNEVLDLDLNNEAHHPEITRQYLYASNFGTAEEIEDQIAEWADLGVLDKKAGQFKPKLDKMQEHVVAKQLADQEHRKQQQEQAARAYMDNVYDTLEGGEIGGVKLDKKTQAMLYQGLVQPNYPSISGKPTNLLGHLLEKYQFVEPNHELIAEALWLLQDPDGYKGKIREIGSKETTEKTVRMLKTEQSKKSAASNANAPEEKDKKPRRTIQRNPGNFFKR